MRANVNPEKIEISPVQNGPWRNVTDSAPLSGDEKYVRVTYKVSGIPAIEGDDIVEAALELLQRQKFFRKYSYDPRTKKFSVVHLLEFEKISEIYEAGTARHTLALDLGARMRRQLNG